MHTVELTEWEDASIARAQGAVFEGAAIEGGRVVFKFIEKKPGEIEQALTKNAAMADAMRWARDTLFRTRRRAGVDGGRRTY